MLYDFVEEFLKRMYLIAETRERMPKISNYYRNYLKFFCRPLMNDLFINFKLKIYSDVKAKVYYKDNYEQQEGSNEKTSYPMLLDPEIKEEIDNYQITATEQSSKFHFNESGLLIDEFTKRSQEEAMIGLLCELDGIQMGKHFSKKLKDRSNSKGHNGSTNDKTKIDDYKLEESRLSPSSKVTQFFNNVDSQSYALMAKKKISASKTKMSKATERKETLQFATGTTKQTSLGKVNSGLKTKVSESIERLKSRSNSKKITVSRNSNAVRYSSSIDKSKDKKENRPISIKLKKKTEILDLEEKQVSKPASNMYQMMGLKQEKEMSVTGFKQRKNCSQETIRRVSSTAKSNVRNKGMYENLVSGSYKQMTVRNKQHPEIVVKAKQVPAIRKEGLKFSTKTSKAGLTKIQLSIKV
jgi:hypothetical protein